MFIVGLPRSRTAWLSVFMSQSNTYFHHEAINGCASVKDYQEKIYGCGDSTTGFAPVFDMIQGQKIVIIKKNEKQIYDCIEWCEREFDIDSTAAVFELDRLLQSFDGLVVNQDDIDNRLEEIWRFLVDDEWLDRYADLSRFNIQLNDTSIDLNAARSLYESI